MIKERYVSREVAILLNEKEFDEECHHIYIGMTLDCTNALYSKDSISNNEVPDVDTDVITAPTQQMACDWVQTKHVLITYDLAPIGTTLMVKVYKRTHDTDFPWTEGITIIRNTLEDAINDALEFALKKLI